MLEKFQKIFNEMGLDENVNVQLDLHEVATILSLVKANEVYMKSLEENLLKSLGKAK